MSRVLLVLATILALVAPWRIMNLAVQTLLVSKSRLYTSQATDRYWDAQKLQTRIELLGWDVQYVAEPSYLGNPAYGITIPMQHLIVIDKDLSWNDRLGVLAHEGAHTLQPALRDTEFECWADSVAYLVAHDGAGNHARYLAHMKYQCVALMATYWPEMYAAAAVLQID